MNKKENNECPRPSLIKRIPCSSAAGSFILIFVKVVQNSHPHFNISAFQTVFPQNLSFHHLNFQTLNSRYLLRLSKKSDFSIFLKFVIRSSTNKPQKSHKINSFIIKRFLFLNTRASRHLRGISCIYFVLDTQVTFLDTHFTENKFLIFDCWVMQLEPGKKKSTA